MQIRHNLACHVTKFNPAAILSGKTMASVVTSDDSSAQYKAKLKAVGIATDPYEMSKDQWSTDLALWPDVEFPEVYVYLIQSPGKFTQQSVKAYKSLDAWGYFKAGFVDEILVTKTEKDLLILAGKVKHSQRMNDAPLRPWFAAQKDGVIVTAHCSCMAGLGETCSHVAALMFSVWAGVRIRGETPVTSLPCQWLQPTLTKQINYAEVASIDLTSPKTQRRKVLENITDNVNSQKVNRVSPVVRPSEERVHDFLNKLKIVNPDAAVLSVAPGFAHEFVPKPLKEGYPVPLSNLYNSENLSIPIETLLKKCDHTFDSIKVTDCQAKLIEDETIGQAKSKLWFQHRAGRITASHFGAVVKSREKPPPSLVKTICYPEALKFTSEATRWGKDHEKLARESFIKDKQAIHLNFKVCETGLVINPKHPHLGASPDGIINCDCCGKGCLEIKCPFSAIGKDLYTVAQQKDFCLEVTDGKLNLKKNHHYYFQILAQIHVTESLYCDFYLWTPTETYSERIYPNKELFLECVEKTSKFFKLGILPELLGKLYTKRVSFQCEEMPSADENETQNEWCLCKKPESGRMIFCDNEQCEVQWFHMKCLKLKCVPKGKWHCPICRKEKPKKS